MYKFRIILALSAFLILGQLKSQNTVVAVGGKIGFSSSSFRGATIDDISRRNLLGGGGFVHIAPGKGIFSIQPEVLYAPKGATYTFAGVRYEYKLNYLEVPLLLKFSIPINGTIYPNLFVGPQAGFRLSEKRTVLFANGGQISNTQKTDGVDYGGVFGGGIDIKLENIMLGLDGRYVLGLNDMKSASGYEDIKNGAFSINFGIGILLK